MYQLISRPTVYLVIGIGVLALMVSQLRSTDNQAQSSVSELDPFNSLENLAGRNLAVLSSDRVSTAVATNVNPIEIARDEMAGDKIVPDEMAGDKIVPDEMVRDAMTSVGAYQQTDAGKLNNVQMEVQPVENSVDEMNVDAMALPLADLDTVESHVPPATEITPVDNSLTVLEMEEPMLLDSQESKERYDLPETNEEIVKTEPTEANPVAMVEESQTAPTSTSAFEDAQVDDQENISLRSRGWRRNPFIDETKSANETLETETSSFEPSINLESDFSEAERVSAVGNFEPRNAPSVVSDIPFSDQPMQSVMSDQDQFVQRDSYRESLPIVIGLSDSVAHKAVHNIEYGKSLSRRGAAFAARQEFYSSLRILAQSHDTQAGGTSYTRALRDAIVALKEAEDFIVSDTETQIGLNVGAVVDGHSTKLISASEASNMTAIGAMQRYFAFANSQLQIASGQNAVAAEALYCLGKLHTVQAKFGANASKLDIAKAIVFHQAAIASDQTNFRSANELGVLMANSGRLQESQGMLKRSLQIQQLPQAWQNLAVVHQRSGQAKLAQLAHKEFLISSRQEIENTGHKSIRWMSPEQFNQGTPLELRQGAQTPQAIEQVPQRDLSKPTISQRLRSFF